MKWNEINLNQQLNTQQPGVYLQKSLFLAQQGAMQLAEQLSKCMSRTKLTFTQESNFKEGVEKPGIYVPETYGEGQKQLKMLIPKLSERKMICLLSRHTILETRFYLSLRESPVGDEYSGHTPFLQQPTAQLFM